MADYNVTISPSIPGLIFAGGTALSFATTAAFVGGKGLAAAALVGLGSATLATGGAIVLGLGLLVLTRTPAIATLGMLAGLGVGAWQGYEYTQEFVENKMEITQPASSGDMTAPELKTDTTNDISTITSPQDLAAALEDNVPARQSAMAMKAPRPV